MFVFAIEWSWLWTKIGTYKIRFDKVNLEEKECTIEKMVKIRPIVNKNSQEQMEFVLSSWTKENKKTLGDKIKTYTVKTG